MQTTQSLVDTARFFESVRDSGYKTPTFAIAELIDNALDASASDIDIDLLFSVTRPEESEIVVIDNGTGMRPAQIIDSLRLGGGVKNNDRSSLGRFGIGLTNASLSLGRRIEVYSWSKAPYVWMTSIDLDKVLSGQQDGVPKPTRVPWPQQINRASHPSGTMIRLSDLDRLKSRYGGPLRRKLRTEFGRIFRQHLYDGLNLRVESRPVEPIDPLFLQSCGAIQARQYGETLVLPVRASETQTTVTRNNRSIFVRFSELPVERSHDLTNDEKRRLGISNGSGVSVLRGAREIDYGWFFMGKKRRENYDDWWRCQVSFSPDLDELFGVTNTKQGIRPQRLLLRILTPHIEAVAQKLNRRTRDRFAAIKRPAARAVSSLLATRNDKYVPKVKSAQRTRTKGEARIVRDLRHEISYEELADGSLFSSTVSGGRVSTRINILHPFGDALRSIQSGNNTNSNLGAIELVELLLHAAGRAEDSLDRSQSALFRDQWAKVLNAYLS